MRLFLSKGWIGVGPYKSKDGNNRFTREYQTWSNMLTRCYSSDNKYSAYKDCYVDDSWLNFQNFAEWCNKQTGFGNKGWCIDKDLLVKDNKLYGPDVCVFIPADLNKFDLKRDSLRGELPIGVCMSEDRYMSQGNFKGFHSKFIGRYDTPQSAFNAYKKVKEAHGRWLAIKFDGLVDERVIHALNNYEVEISD